MNNNDKLDFKWRLLGVAPFLFFALQTVHYVDVNQLGHLLWMCNIGNLLLAVALFLDLRGLARIAIIWTIPGLFIWFVYVVLEWGVFLTSTLAHVGGLCVALIALGRIRMGKRAWVQAFVWYLLVQLLSRFLTDPALNVNLAHSIDPHWQQAFSHYWKFLLILDALTAGVLCGVCLLLWKWKPETTTPDS